jgi:hypothetical protein
MRSEGGGSRRRALSLVEVLLGAFIIGVSALPILELMRSGTESLEITETEAAARQLGADLLRRLAGPRTDLDLGLSKNLENDLKARPTRWEQMLEEDPALKHGFPADALKGLLDNANVRLSLEVIAPYPHEALGKAPAQALIVTVFWTDRNGRDKKVKLARLVDM